ncbi:MAG: hypothetical protein RLP15_07510 [Cryomorphaceae bacterium]
MRYLTLILCLCLVSCSSSKRKGREGSNESPASKSEAPAPEISENAPTTEKVEDVRSKATDEGLWVLRDVYSLPDLERRIELSTFTTYACDFEQLTDLLDQGDNSVAIPTLNGIVSFHVENAQTMSPELAAKFPDIRSYKGKSIDGKLTIRLDTNEEGLFASIVGTGTKTLISPILKGSKNYYAIYTEDALPPGAPRDGSYR